MSDPEIMDRDERLEELRRTPVACSFNHAILDEEVRVVSMCPMAEPWQVTITAETRIKRAGQLPWEWERTKEEPETFPVIGWGVLDDGTVEPLFVDITSAVTCPSKYRRHDHYCDTQEDGALEEAMHRIVVEKI